MVNGNEITARVDDGVILTLSLQGKGRAFGVNSGHILRSNISAIAYC